MLVPSASVMVALEVQVVQPSAVVVEVLAAKLVLAVLEELAVKRIVAAGSARL
jgi:predicted transcriptional regulator